MLIHMSIKKKALTYGGELSSCYSVSSNEADDISDRARVQILPPPVKLRILSNYKQKINTKKNNHV